MIKSLADLKAVLEQTDSDLAPYARPDNLVTSRSQVVPGSIFIERSTDSLSYRIFVVVTALKRIRGNGPLSFLSLYRVSTRKMFVVDMWVTRERLLSDCGIPSNPRLVAHASKLYVYPNRVQAKVFTYLFGKNLEVLNTMAPHYIEK